MKESVTKFDFEAAFKALDEIDMPISQKGIKANRPALNEIFSRKSKFDSLFEEYYDISNTAELSEAQEEREAEIAKAKLARIEKIVDLDAKSPEDLLTSYVGKFIIQCPQCMTLFYKAPEDVVESEEDATVVNVEEVCQHCGNETGYTLIGKVGEATPEEMDNFDTSELDLEATEEAGEEEVSEEDDTKVIDVDSTEEDSEEAELDTGLEELDLNLENEEDEKKEESFHFNTEANTLVEELQEDAELDTSADDFEKLINSPEFKQPISDNAVRTMMQEFDDSEEGEIEEELELNNETLRYAVINANGTYAGVPCTSKEEAREVAAQQEGRVIVELGVLKESLTESTDLEEYNLVFEPATETKEEDFTDALCDAVSKVGVKYHSAKKLADKYSISILGSEDELQIAKVAIENCGFFKNWDKTIVEEAQETLEEGGLGLLGKTIGKKLKQTGQKIKDKASAAIDKFADKTMTREEKANFILENALEDYGKAKIDPNGGLVADENNRRFGTFVIMCFTDKYSNGKAITLIPSYDNTDLVLGENGLQFKDNYADADKIAKGWSMEQGNGPAFIYMAKSKNDDNAVYLCQYYKGDIKTDKLEKYFEVVKSQLEGAELMADGEMEQPSEKATSEAPEQSDKAVETADEADFEETAEEAGLTPLEDTDDVNDKDPDPIKEEEGIEYKEIPVTELKKDMIINDSSYTSMDTGAAKELKGIVTDVKNLQSKGVIAVTIKHDDGKVSKIAIRPENNITIEVDELDGVEILDRAAATQEGLTTVMSGLEELNESYLENAITEALIKTYKDVAGFRLKACNYLEESFNIEGTIVFTSGNIKNTTYRFKEAIQKGNKILFSGLNENFGLDKQFTIIGENLNKTLITEAFNFYK